MSNIRSLSPVVALSLCAALSAPAGCAPEASDDLSGATDNTVGELSSSTLNAMVIAYASTDGSNTGPHQSYGAGVYRASAGDLAAVGNDLTRVLEIAPATRVRVCQNDAAPLGTCAVYENLGGSNRVVSVAAGISRIEVRPIIVAYRDANYGGVAQGFEIGRYDSLARIATVGNDTISSVRVPAGLKVYLCSDDPELTVGGTCRYALANTAQVPTDINNSVSWLNVEPVTTTYRDANFAGVSQNFGPGTFPVSSLFTLGNDTLTSLVVPEGVTTRACSDDPTNTIGYTCVTFTRSSLQVPSTLDNRTSWMDISHTVILSPLNEDSVYTDTFTLRGYGVAASGATIPDASLRWYSSVNGYLGTGRRLVAPLSGPATGCGGREHTITLTATDAQGRVFSTSRVLTVYRIC